MIYRAITLLLAIMICDVLVVIVVPNLVAASKELHADLPLPTKGLIALVTFAEIWPINIVAGGLLLAFAALVLLGIRRR